MCPSDRINYQEAPTVTAICIGYPRVREFFRGHSMDGRANEKREQH